MSAKVPASETREEFLARVGRVFPVERAQAWSRVERAVFNSLMARAIFRHGYGAISDAMLRELRHDMERLVRLCERGAPAAERALA